MRLKLSMLVVAVVFAMSCAGTGEQTPTTNGQSVQKLSLVATKQFDDEVSDIALKGNYLYVAAEYAGIYIVDVSNPKVLTNYVRFTNDLTGPVKSITVKGDYLFASAGQQGLVAFEISSDYTNLTKKATFTKSGIYAYDCYVDESLSYAYLANSSGELDVLDLSSLASGTITETNNLSLSGKPYGVFVSGNYAYVACGDGGVSIVDVSDKSSSSLSSIIYTTGNECVNVYYEDTSTKLFIADEFRGLRIYDLSKPSFPNLVLEYTTSGYTSDLVKSGNRVYIADGYNGVRVVNIADLENPYEEAYYDTSGNAKSLIYPGGYYIYVADGYGGLVILKQNF